ncbi:hypothetical protein OHV05_35485 (plasmid) [Kitasatospora sp. NBC_00070]|uniref:hypothetical protein n=1 Tax=Kitasatospora sp. NBC_00070 TaxID=2975962 RepID=UPI002F912628
MFGALRVERRTDPGHDPLTNTRPAYLTLRHHRTCDRADALIVLDEDGDDLGVGAVGAARMDLADTVGACWFSGTSEWKGFNEDNRILVLKDWKKLLGDGFSAVCETLPDRDHTLEGQTPQAVIAFDAAASAWALDAERFLRMYEAVPYTAMPGWGYRTNRAAVYNYTNTAPGSENFLHRGTWYNQEEFNRQVATRKPATAPAAGQDPAGTTATRASRLNPEYPGGGREAGDRDIAPCCPDRPGARPRRGHPRKAAAALKTKRVPGGLAPAPSRGCPTDPAPTKRLPAPNFTAAVPPGAAEPLVRK